MRLLPALALAALLPLAACGNNDPAPSGGDAATAPPANTALGRKIQSAMAEASRKLATENIRVGDESANPRAEISPAGDLLVDGRPVAIDEAQRKLLLAHRANLVAIAQAGIAVGMQGADLGIEAATGALKSVFAGDTGEFEKRMEARGKEIEVEAQKICARLPALLESQQALAAALPAFGPYATMDQSDIEDCGKDGNYNVDIGGTHASAQLDSGDDADTEHMDAAAEADAAAARPGN
ncbi:YggN family protein [Pseudoxanthomonas sp. 10H]|uniref:hypothetical protein n=1 Tax=Pseudoxanthomonas sp. 10H TaxID=3242729 RepID=UPI00355617FC